jgi:hypothetical protein
VIRKLLTCLRDGARFHRWTLDVAPGEDAGVLREMRDWEATSAWTSRATASERQAALRTLLRKDGAA